MHLAGIEPRDQLKYISKARALGQSLKVGANADLSAGRQLVADVDLGRRILSDQHDRKPGLATVLTGERRHLRSDLLSQPCGDCPAIQHACRHRPMLSIRLIIVSVQQSLAPGALSSP